MMIGTSMRERSSRHDLDAVAPGQHQVEHDAVVLAAQRLGLTLEAIGGRRDQHAVAFEVARGQLREARVVLDEEDLDRGRSFGHTDTISTTPQPRGTLHTLQLRGSSFASVRSSTSMRNGFGK